jgi:hypothetical protein
MTIAAEVAALLESALGLPGLQPTGTVLSLAPIAGLGDRPMSQGSHVISLLTSLTSKQIDALTPVDRRLLKDQLERVHSMVTGATIMSDARKATVTESGEPKRSKAAFLDELRDGQGRE